jgi:hypothetical protein
VIALFIYVVGVLAMALYLRNNPYFWDDSDLLDDGDKTFHAFIWFIVLPIRFVLWLVEGKE